VLLFAGLSRAVVEPTSTTGAERALQQAPAPRGANKSERIDVFFLDSIEGEIIGFQGPLTQTSDTRFEGYVTGLYNYDVTTNTAEGEWICVVDITLTPGQEVFRSYPTSVVYTSNRPVTLQCKLIYGQLPSSGCIVTSMTLKGTTLKCGVDSSKEACRNRFIRGGGSPSSSQLKQCYADAAATNLQLVTNCGNIQVAAFAQVLSKKTSGGRKRA
jgi:hypothetical protein